jgi:hypothetical protein
MTTMTKKQKIKLKEKLIRQELNRLGGKGLRDLIRLGVSKVLGCKNPNPAFDYTPKKNPTELHQVLHKDGCLYNAKFSGPNTHVQENIMELLAKHEQNISLALADGNFASKIDLAALAHDLRYLLSNGPDDVSAADKKFVEVGSTLKDKINSVPAVTAIKAKIAIGNKFSGSEKVDEATKPLMEKVLEFAKMKGYGRPDRVISCEFCGSQAKNQAIHQKSKACINKKNNIFN